ncbi:23S rRNA (guanine(745)-N(1))-methyltransferase [Vibrio tapetis subsp. quintayensis]|uniref:23S rRNA (guanine(745)-N(1))-methyltransferase n=1 Tax=Vibrio tapetis TaxID=52443 RepID=UPI0025B4E9B3|nr:23S rRNA (guanine(745)-N(1))-methyltransferase [Vibrio tapetis]MDN3680530.1 23S rRNA (guanine(745)-N(1))-methyltransferase [Vibrio tapetis subsp. quintayensis]
MTYQCPLCHLSLSQHDRMFKCENNHQFDVAKEGYVNLVPAHHKRSKNPGDNKEMIQARRRFLDGGYYQPMRDAVAAICGDHLLGSQYQLLDIGCGEGYYTQEVARHLSSLSGDARTYGLDISKVAVRFAAKRYSNCEFTVASSHRLPFEDASLDAVLRIYAPCKADELNRCVKSGGIVVTVTPAGRHLYQLRERIYPDVRMHDETPENIEGFQLAHQEKLNYTMPLKGGDAFDLLQMTPFAWKASDELRQELQSCANFDCEADFVIRVYKKA